MSPSDPQPGRVKHPAWFGSVAQQRIAELIAVGLRDRGARSLSELQPLEILGLELTPDETAEALDHARRHRFVEVLDHEVRPNGRKILEPEWALTDLGREVASQLGDRLETDPLQVVRSLGKILTAVLTTLGLTVAAVVKETRDVPGILSLTLSSAWLVTVAVYAGHRALARARYMQFQLELTEGWPRFQAAQPEAWLSTPDRVQVLLEWLPLVVVSAVLPLSLLSIFEVSDDSLALANVLVAAVVLSVIVRIVRAQRLRRRRERWREQWDDLLVDPK